MFHVILRAKCLYKNIVITEPAWVWWEKGRDGGETDCGGPGAANAPPIGGATATSS